MSNDSPSRGPRTAAPAPMGSTVAIVVTAVALVLGFLILRKVNSGPDDAGTTPVVTETPGDTTIDPTQSTIATTTSPTTDVAVTPQRCIVPAAISRAPATISASVNATTRKRNRRHRSIRVRMIYSSPLISSRRNADFT